MEYLERGRGGPTAASAGSGVDALELVSLRPTATSYWRLLKIMRNDSFRDELTINELDLVSGGVAAPNVSASSPGEPDVTADARKSSGGMYLVFQFKLVAVRTF
jgi:hypothetical protein